MPGKLVDMQITYTADSEKLARGIYDALPSILIKKIEFYNELLQLSKADRAVYLARTRQAPTAVRDRLDDVNRYLEEVHGKGYDDFCALEKEMIFGNKEFKPKLGNSRGRDVYFIASFKGYHGEDDPNVGYIKLLLVLDALKRASAKGRIVVAPYMPYERQDRKDESRVPISFKMFADLLATAGATRILTMDMHAPQEQGFFDIPVDDLTPINLFLEKLREIEMEDRVTLIDPDAGSAKRNSDLAGLTSYPQAIVDKRRMEGDPIVKGANGLDKIEGRVGVIADDLIASGGTMERTAEMASTYRPKRIIGMGTHLLGNPSKLFNPDGSMNDPEEGLKRLQESRFFNVIYATDSNYSESWTKYPKFVVMQTSHLLAEAIFETQTDGSVTRLFPKKPGK